MSVFWRDLIPLSLLATALTLENPAHGQISPPVWELCAQTTNPDAVQGACSSLIEAGALSTETLAQVLARRGRAYYQARRYASAFADFDRAATLVPNVAAYHRNRGLARGNLLRGSADALAGAEQLEKALGDFTEAVRLDPKDALNLVFRGDAYIALGRYERGLDDLNQAVALNPESAEAHDSRGQAFHVLRQDRRALEDFDIALRLNPGVVNTWINRGLSHGALEDYDHAIADFDEAIRLDPSSVNAFNARGVSYVKHGRTDRAIADFDHALILDPNYADAYFNRGQAYYLKGNKDRAMADFIQARQLDKRFPELPEELLEGYEVDIDTLYQRPRPFSR